MMARDPGSASDRGASGAAGGTATAGGAGGIGLSRLSLALLLAGCSTIAGVARAQDATPADNRLFVSTGLAYAAQRDQRISPLAYAGAGPVASVGFVRRTGRARFEIALAGARRRTTSGITHDDRPYERGVLGRLRVGYYRRIAGGAGRRAAWFVGGAARMELSGIDHHSADMPRQVGSYGLGYLALAPPALWTRPVGREGEISARLGVPLLAVVSRPYFNRGFDITVPLRVVSLDTFRAASGAIRYAHPLGARTEALVAYRLSALAYQDAQPYRRLEQALTVSLSLHLGGVAP
jgi:hypothetical protein